VVGIAALVRLMTWLLPHWARWLRERSLNSELRPEVAGITMTLLEVTTQSITVGAGVVLTPLHSAQKIDAALYHAVARHLNTLHSYVASIGMDLDTTALRPTAALSRLAEVHRAYIHLCEELAMVVDATGRSELRRDWRTVAEHANRLSHRIREAESTVRVGRGEQAVGPYFGSVPAP
jgi:hypothetical protein